MKKVLIISYWFPPLNASAVLRLYAFTKYMPKHGYSVTVLTSSKKHITETDERMDTSGISVVEVDFNLANSISNINAIRQEDNHGINIKKTSVNKLLHFSEKIKKWLFGNLFTPEDFWLFGALKKAKTLFIENKYDIVLSSYGPISCHLVAYALKKKYPDILWLADYRDLWSYNDYFARPKWPLYLFQRKFEKVINNQADYLITVSEPLKEALAEDFKGEVLVIENGYFPDDFHVECTDNIENNDTFQLIHTGTIYDQFNIEPLLLAVKELFSSGLLDRDKFRIIFFGDNTKILCESIERHCLTDAIILHNKISRNNSLLIQRRASSLLFLGYETPFTKDVMSGKIFEYIISEKPIIAIGISNNCSAGKLIENSNTGYVCGNNIELIKSAIMLSVDNVVFVPNKNVIDYYSRDRLVDKLCSFLSQEPKLNCHNETKGHNHV